MHGRWKLLAAMGQTDERVRWECVDVRERVRDDQWKRIREEGGCWRTLEEDKEKYISFFYPSSFKKRLLLIKDL